MRLSTFRNLYLEKHLMQTREFLGLPLHFIPMDSFTSAYNILARYTIIGFTVLVFPDLVVSSTGVIIDGMVAGVTNMVGCTTVQQVYGWWIASFSFSIVHSLDKVTSGYCPLEPHLHLQIYFKMDGMVSSFARLQTWSCFFCVMDIFCRTLFMILDRGAIDILIDVHLGFIWNLSFHSFIPKLWL